MVVQAVSSGDFGQIAAALHRYSGWGGVACTRWMGAWAFPSFYALDWDLPMRCVFLSRNNMVETPGVAELNEAAESLLPPEEEDPSTRQARLSAAEMERAQLGRDSTGHAMTAHVMCNSNNTMNACDLLLGSRAVVVYRARTHVSAERPATACARRA